MSQCHAEMEVRLLQLCRWTVICFKEAAMSIDMEIIKPAQFIR
jgi:hypothetical protein